MEKLIKRSFAFAALLLVAGIAFTLLPSQAASSMTEEVMKKQSPKVVGSFQMQVHPDDPEVSYIMDKSTYEMLNPTGIVARVYQKGNKSFDVVLISGKDRDNFHDPRICFDAQGWRLDNESVVEIQSKTYGVIPASLVRVTNEGRQSQALYFYQGPKGFYPKTPDLNLAMVMGPLLGKFDTNVVFYRFMPHNSNVTDQELLDFVSQYMDVKHEMNKTS